MNHLTSSHRLKKTAFIATCSARCRPV